MIFETLLAEFSERKAKVQGPLIRFAHDLT